MTRTFKHLFKIVVLAIVVLAAASFTLMNPTLVRIHYFWEWELEVHLTVLLSGCASVFFIAGYGVGWFRGRKQPLKQPSLKQSYTLEKARLGKTT